MLCLDDEWKRIAITDNELMEEWSGGKLVYGGGQRVYGIARTNIDKSCESYARDSINEGRRR